MDQIDLFKNDPQFDIAPLVGAIEYTARISAEG